MVLVIFLLIVCVRDPGISAYNMGVDHGKADDYEKAIEHYTKAIKINPKLVKAYNARCLSYSQLGQFERAIQDCDKAIQLNSNYFDAYHNRGIAYDNLGQHKRAIKDYDIATELNSV